MASGDADFSLSRIAGHLVAVASSPEPLAARFAAVLVRRSPISAFVPAGAPARRPADLGGLRVAGAVWAMAEFVGGMAELGLTPAVVPLSRTSGGGLLQEACALLGRGDVDMVADYEDLLPRVRRHTGMEVRSVPLGLDVYSSGLVAADRLSRELADRMVGAVVAALARQRHAPDLGLPELLTRSPRVVADDAREGWRLVEPRIFTGDRPGSMDPGRWEATVRHLARAHRLPAVPARQVYRQEHQPASARGSGGER